MTEENNMEEVAEEEVEVNEKKRTKRIREPTADILIAFPQIFRAIFSTLALSLHCSRSFFY